MREYQVGDEVRLVRPLWWAAMVPVGCLGVIVEPVNEAMAARGKPYRVEFDVAEYRLGFSEPQYEKIADVLGHDAHHMLADMVATDVGPEDIELLE